MTKNRNRSKGGFTLVELMVVAIIVAVLAAVAIPLMSANVTRAIGTEAESALGTARSNFRAMYAETGAYNVNPTGGTVTAGAVIGRIPGFRAGDLDGTYFTDASYAIKSVTSSNYVLIAKGDDATSSKKAKIAGVEIELDSSGNFTRRGY